MEFRNGTNVKNTAVSPKVRRYFQHKLITNNLQCIGKKLNLTRHKHPVPTNPKF
jgi:hypothetical protein